MTGILHSLSSAINLKRNADVISDTIVAEDIGKFPEQNLAESLQRITGVQIQRTNGEGQFVSVRGLDPKFTQVDLEGRVVPSASSGARSFDFTIFPSDFVRSVSVYKTPTADLNEGGLAGTATVALINPLDVKKNELTVSLKGAEEQYTGKVGPRISAIYQARALDGKLGVVLGGYYNRRQTRNYSYVAFGMQNYGPDAQSDPAHINGPATSPYLFDNAQSFNANNLRLERTSALAGLSYKFSPSFNIYTQFVYSRYVSENKNIADVLRYTNLTASQCTASGNTGIEAITIGSNSIATSLDAKCVDYRNNSRYGIDTSTLKMASAGANFGSGNFTGNLDGYYALSNHKSTNYALEVIGRANASSTIGSGPAVWKFDPGYDPLDPSSFNALGFNGGIDQPTKDRIASGKLSLKYRFDGGFIKSISAGARYADEVHSSLSNSLLVSPQITAQLLGQTYNPAVEAENGGSFPAGPYLSQFTYPMFGQNLTFLAADLNKVFSKASLASLIAASPPVDDLADSYEIRERDIAGFVRADFEAGPTVRGNVGMRVVHTNTTSNGYSPDLSQIIFNQQGAVTTIPNVTPATVKHSYWDFLPSLNLSWQPSDNLQLRFGAARTMTRPDLGTGTGLAPNTSVNANVLSISSGNPDLKPYRANQVDLSAEWYFAKDSLLSGALFYKWVDGFIQTQTSSITLNVQQAGGGTIPLTFSVFKPVNASSTTVKGLELSYQQPFTFLGAPFDHMGMLLNYTFVSAGKVQVTAGGPLTPLTGVSKHNASAIGYYEDKLFGLRLAYTYRSGYVTDTSSFFGDGDYRKSYGQVDASLDVHATKWMDVTLEGINLLNAKTTDTDVYGISRNLEQDGRTIMFGVRAKF